MYVFMGVCVVSVCVCARVYQECMCMCGCVTDKLSIYVYAYVIACMLQRFQTRLVRSGRVIGEVDSCPLWPRYTGDSKTDPWDDP